MSSVIKIRNDTTWGTCCCVNDGEGLLFITATHVLAHMGLAFSENADVEMCDMASPMQQVSISGIVRYPECDISTFRCEYPASSFARTDFEEGDGLTASGYLNLEGKEPECSNPSVKIGKVRSIGKREGCVLTSILIHLNMHTGHLHGMSGGPVVKTVNGVAVGVIGILAGAPYNQGGPPFVATALP